MGHCSMHTPQYMHRAQSISKVSSTLWVRPLAPGAGVLRSWWEERWMHQVGHSLAQIMQEVHRLSMSSM